MLVTTTRPRLAASARASPSTSPLPTPIVMITLLAIVPQVSSVISGSASVHRRRGVRGAELHRLLPLELDRVDGDDPLGAGQPAPWMAFAPMPPTPTTATVSPGCTSAA